MTVSANHSVKQGDTHAILIRVFDETTGLPLDLTGADVAVYARLRGGEPILLAATIHGDPTQGVLRHQLTGTLQPGTYSLIVKTKKGAEQATAPTEDFDCLTVTPTFGASL